MTKNSVIQILHILYIPKNSIRKKHISNVGMFVIIDLLIPWY